MKWRDCLDVVFPPVCTHCGACVEDSPLTALCAECAARLEPAPGPGVVRFTGPGRALVLALKYRRQREVLRDIDLILRRSPRLLALAAGAVIVPVPLAAERERGFNQAELIARLVVRAAPGARCQRLLHRTAEGPAQATLGRAGRAANAKNAFALPRGAMLNRSSRHLIIDDVTTTGSTLESCAQALSHAGCARIDVAAFAQG